MTDLPAGYGGGSGSRQTVAGLLAAVAIFISFIALAWHPFVIGSAAIILALVATAMGGRNQRLAAISVAFAMAGWFFGMVIAAVGSRALF